MKFKITLLSLLCFILSGQIMAQSYSEYKRMNKTFKVSHTGSISIDNKYGKIHVSTWNKDSISINAVINAKAGASDKLNKLLENITFNFHHTSYFITAKTVFGKSRSSFISDLKDLVNQQGNISVDYTIKAPKYVDIDISNKYGDVYISRFMGRLKLNLSNGFLQAEELGGENEITLKFSKGVIKKVNSSTFNVAFDSELNIHKAGQITLNTNMAKINIVDADVLKINSKSDEYKINNVKYLYGKSYFSSITVEAIADEVSMENIYGSVSMGILPTFSFINITSKFIATYNLSFPKNCSYRLDALHKNSTLNFKLSPPNLQQKRMENDKRSTLTYGYVGKKTDDSKVRINAEDCTIYFLDK